MMEYNDCDICHKEGFMVLIRDIHPLPIDLSVYGECIKEVFT